MLAALLLNIPPLKARVSPKPDRLADLQRDEEEMIEMLTMITSNELLE